MSPFRNLLVGKTMVLTNFQNTVMNVQDLKFTALTAGPADGELVPFCMAFPNLRIHGAT
jgi:hypothetical protein